MSTTIKKIIKFINDVDNESLSSGKTINIKLIKKDKPYLIVFKNSIKLSLVTLASKS